MARACEHLSNDSSNEEGVPTSVQCLCVCGQRGCDRPIRIAVVNTDRSLLELIAEWLAPSGFCVMESRADGTTALRRFDVAVVDVPFPRQSGLELLRRIASNNPGTPIVALSSSFFPGIESGGAVARALGVERVLPMPVKRDVLVMAVRQVLRLEP